MTRRRVLCGLLLASAVLACFAGWLVIASGPRVTRERFEQVKKGMSREEVIHIVGVPPEPALPRCEFVRGRFLDYNYWVGDAALLFVSFDDGGTAVDVVVVENTSPTFTERIRRWLGL